MYWAQWEKRSQKRCLKLCSHLGHLDLWANREDRNKTWMCICTHPHTHDTHTYIHVVMWTHQGTQVGWSVNFQPQASLSWFIEGRQVFGKNLMYLGNWVIGPGGWVICACEKQERDIPGPMDGHIQEEHGLPVFIRAQETHKQSCLFPLIFVHSKNEYLFSCF